MKNMMKKALISLMVIGQLVGMMTVSAMSKEKNSSDTDSSGTFLHNGNEDNNGNNNKAEFDEQDITVNINGVDYQFSHSGSGSWKNDGEVPELNLSDEGENSSIGITITHENGNKYTANLSNHSAANGNNKNNKSGTDNYKISGVAKVEQIQENQQS